MSFIGLIVVAVVIAALIRGGGGANVLSWAATLGATLLVMVFIVAALRFVYSPHAPHGANGPDLTMIAERAAHGEVFHNMHGGWVHAPTRTETTLIKGGAMLLLIPVLLLAFSAVKSCRRSGGRVLVPILGGAALLLFFGGYASIRESRTTYSSPHEHVESAVVLPMAQSPLQDLHLPVAPAAPMDELWDRLTHPRIALDEQSPAPASPAAEGLPDGAMPADNEAHLTDEQRAAQTAAVSAAIEAGKLAGAKIKEITAFVSTAAAEASKPAADNATAAHAIEISAPTAAEIAPQPKPDWVVTPPKLAGPVQRIVVQAGPYSTLNECHEALRGEIRKAVERRVVDLASEWSGREVDAPPLERMGLGNTLIDRELVIDQYVEPGEASFGPVKTAWALLEFDQSDDRNLLEAWQSFARRDGIAMTALGSAAVLGFLGLVLGLIKVDTWTRGYYTKRLFIGVPAAIIAVVMLMAAMS